jgi:hypothetical protein
MGNARVLQCLLAAECEESAELLEPRSATPVEHVPGDKLYAPTYGQIELAWHLIKQRHPSKWV